jgi:hypothetical protein
MEIGRDFMSLNFSCVVSFHTNPYTCGVARFNRALADEMQIPLLSIDAFATAPLANALVSVKFDEMSPEATVLLGSTLLEGANPFLLLLHDVHKTPEEVAFCHRAVKVFAANAELCAKLQDVRPDALAAFAPGAAEQKKSGTFDLTLITFGMAHKIRSDRYKKLGQLLRGDARSAQLEISTALHEGTSFSEEFFSVNTEISEAFEGNVSFLGFLADGEVSRRILAADALVAFFPKGARENNTTVLSAMAHGCCVITNLDEGSPSWMKHGDSVLDIDQLTELPSAQELRRVGNAARAAVAPYSFQHLAVFLNQ